MDVKIGGREVSRRVTPLIVAELSGNHNGSLSRALQLVNAAADAGADAIKIQTYTPDTMTVDCNLPEFRISDPKSLWHGRTLYDLYREAQLPWEWHRPIFELARSRGLLAFSTPFDESAVDFLEELNVPCYKIASFENTDLPLIEKVASTGKPLILSSGMATAEELAEAIESARRCGSGHVILLKCCSAYPAPMEEMNLLAIPDMSRRFDLPVGLSDHSPGTTVATAAVALGAVLIEKHFTLARSDGGPDAEFSLEPEEFRQLVVNARTAWSALGTANFEIGKCERASYQFRRSVRATRNISEGERLTADNVRCIRPAGGLEPKHYARVLRSRARTAILRGATVTADNLIYDS